MNKDNNLPLDSKSVNAIIANGSLFYNNWNDTMELVSNLYDVLLENGMMWSDWRAKEDSLYGMGEEVEKDFFKMNDESGRNGCYYHFFDEGQLRSIYEQAGFKNILVDKYMYTENNKKKKNVWWHVIAKK